MSNGTQIVSICGTVGREPEVTYSAGGTAIAKFTVAVNEQVKAQGNWEQHTEWFSCVVFGKTAESYIGPYMKKGMMVSVVGKLRSRMYNEKKYTDLIVDQIMFGGGGGKKSEDAPRQSGKTPPAQQDAFDDDIPF